MKRRTMIAPLGPRHGPRTLRQCYYSLMSRAGFVLVGGRSRRMGRDKALLPYSGSVLAGFVARTVEAAAGSVKLVGTPERYGHLGVETIADLRPDAGPLGGIEAALTATTAEWNLVVACDMPGAPVRILRELLDAAERSGADCVVPLDSGGRPQPLCAVYHRRCRSAVTHALDQGRRAVRDLLPRLRRVSWMADTDRWLENLNTPRDWHNHLLAISETEGTSPGDEPVCPLARGLGQTGRPLSPEEKPSS